MPLFLSSQSRMICGWGWFWPTDWAVFLGVLFLCWDQELGLSYVELNASDTRSKNSLKEVVAESLNNTSIKGFCSGISIYMDVYCFT